MNLEGIFIQIIAIQSQCPLILILTHLLMVTYNVFAHPSQVQVIELNKHNTTFQLLTNNINANKQETVREYNVMIDWDICSPFF